MKLYDDTEKCVGKVLKTPDGYAAYQFRTFSFRRWSVFLGYFSTLKCAREQVLRDIGTC